MLRRLGWIVVFVVLLWFVVVERELFGPDVSNYGRQAQHYGRQVRDRVVRELSRLGPPELAFATPSVAPTASSTAAPVPLGAQLVDSRAVYVGNTGGDGVYLRKTSRLDDRLTAYPDGTILVVIGPDVEAEGRAWRHVRTPDGAVGYVPAQYTVSGLPTATTPRAKQAITVTPTADALQTVVSLRQPLTPLRAWPPARSCADLTDPSWQLVHDLIDLGAYSDLQPPRFCLLRYAERGTYHGATFGATTLEEFRAVKAEAVGRLAEMDFDVCSIVTWAAYGLTLGDEPDRWSLPVLCQPQVVAADPAADPAAEVWVEDVQQLIPGFVALTAEQMGQRPRRPLTILVWSGSEMAYARHPRVVADGPTERGSWFSADPLLGQHIVLRIKDADAQRLEPSLLHEYTHYAQRGIGGETPAWFIEGQAVYQENRNGYPRAYVTQPDLRLTDLGTHDQWIAQLQRRSSRPVYGYASAAFSYLAEQYGFVALLQLLRDNRGGTYATFERDLAVLTGMDLARLDAAVREWVQGRLRITYGGRIQPRQRGSLGRIVPYFVEVTGVDLRTLEQVHAAITVQPPAAEVTVDQDEPGVLWVAIRAEAPAATYTVTVALPDGRSAETAFQHGASGAAP